MDPGVILKFAHIGTMFMAVGVAVGTEVMAHRVANTGDVGSIRTFFAQAKPVMVLIPILYVSGFAFGLAAGLAGAFDMFATWLLLAYGLFFLTFVLHRTIGAPWFERMTLLSAAAPDGAAGGELLAVIHDPRARLLLWYTIAMIIAFVFIMVAKPLS
jgi:thiosulfate reductase cytochrome b subunit